MTRDELAALRDAIDTVLTWPDSVRAEIARWLAPAAAKPGNGLDLHPPVAPPVRTDQELLGAVQRSSTKPTPYAGKARRAKPSPAKAAEQRLLTAMRENPGLSVNALANGGGLEPIGDRRKTATIGAARRDREGSDRQMETEGNRAGPSAAVAGVTPGGGGT